LAGRGGGSNAYFKYGGTFKQYFIVTGVTYSIEVMTYF
jgi:hypothetical protein